jgi:hypothetical protein
MPADIVSVIGTSEPSMSGHATGGRLTGGIEGMASGGAQLKALRHLPQDLAQVVDLRIGVG